MTPWYNPDFATTLQNGVTFQNGVTLQNVDLRLPVGYCGTRALEIATENVPIEVEQESIKLSADKD